MNTLGPSWFLRRSDAAPPGESCEGRLDVLEGVNSLLANNDDGTDQEKIGAVADLFCGRLDHWEKKALIELSVVMAPVVNAPAGIIHKLAFHSEIAVARPVLVSSTVLTTDCLVEIVKTRSQGHLLAVSERAQLDAAVTDALVDLGNKYVLYSVASNTGACFSERGFIGLVKASGGSDRIAEKLGLRRDLPVSLFRDLLSQVEAEIRMRILAERSDVPGSINLFGGVK